MAFDRWRIGMDMEPEVLRALALSRDRAEWRCRGWWQFPLPMARDAQGDPCPVAVTVDALRRWRRQLPRRLPSLPVHRLDIAAAALRRMARACGRHPALPLVHQCVSGAYLSRCTAGVAVGLCLWHRVGGGLGDCRRVGAGAGRAAMEQVNLWPWRQTHRQRPPTAPCQRQARLGRASSSGWTSVINAICVCFANSRRCCRRSCGSRI